MFEENYDFMNWREKENYIFTNKHLPYIPNAKEIDKNGLDIGTGMAAITQNVEENTIDIIQLYKKMIALETEVEKLKKENSELKIKR